MQIKDLMSRDVQFVEPDTPVVDIAKTMRDKDVGSMPVAENDKLVGMITDRDIVLRCVAESHDPLTTLAREVMSPGILYTFETQDVEKAIDNMAQNRIRRMPVVDEEKNLTGFVSLGDLAAYCDKEDKCGEALEEIRKAA